MADSPPLQVKRIYEPPAPGDGLRVLVDRLWPRGVSKAGAKLDLWAKHLAPTTELRKWFNHQPDRFDEFRVRYLEELDAKDDALAELTSRADGGPITLLYAARDPACNHAIILQDWLRQRMPRA